MRRKITGFLVLLLLFVSFGLSTQKKLSPKDLPERYRKWLEEEVVYIITQKEKDVFLMLETDRERELFIEAFWKQRDPTPNTTENESKEEHYRRISYSNQWFGKESPGPGWRTDMGRIYITLGEPRTIEKFENLTEVYPTIIWFYEGLAEYGLPNAFNVVFFKRSGIGEYELYSPIKFGPQHLLIHYTGDATNYLSAFNELNNIEPSIASISLSLIPGELTHVPSPSMASEILISQMIPSVPHEKVKDAYAEKLLKYKDIIEVDYSANYISNDSLIRVIRDQSGLFFVHYLIEPQRLSLEQVGNRYYTKLEVNGKISDGKGNLIFQYDRIVPIEFNKDQIDNIKAKLFSFQDMIPLIEGNYKFDLLLKNSISKEFTSEETDLTVPAADSLQMSPLTLANKLVKDSKYIGKNKPFLINNIQLVPSPRNDFCKEDILYLFFQIHGLKDDIQENGILEYSILREGKTVRSSTKKLREYPDKINFLEEFSLEDLPAAYYTAKVSLFDGNRKEILVERSNFYISPRTFLPRPWVLSIPMPPSRDPLYSNILGNQYLNKKDMEKAKPLLERAYQSNPSSPKFAMDYSRMLFTEKDYKKVKEIALPFLNNEEKYEFLEILGRSCQALGELAQAIFYYKDYLSHYGANLFILNALGECFYALGNKEEALIAWEKSLEINPKQEDLKKKVESIKEKK